MSQAAVSSFDWVRMPLRGGGGGGVKTREERISGVDARPLLTSEAEQDMGAPET